MENKVEKNETTPNKKSGHNFKPLYIMGGVIVLLVVILVAVFLMLRPKPLEGSYSSKIKANGATAYLTFKFQDKDKVGIHESDGIEENGKFKELAKSDDKATYKIKGDKLTILLNNHKEEIDGKLSKDRNSIKVKDNTFKKDDKK